MKFYGFFFYLRDGKRGGGDLTSTTIPLGPWGLPWFQTVLTGQHDSCTVRMWYFLSLCSLAQTRMFLRDFPLLYDKRGGSLKFLLTLDDFV